MKTIGFVDYYISEWHANNYVGWIRQVNEKLGTDYVVKYAWAEKEVSAFDGRTTDEWCKDFGVTRCDTIEELCEKSDNIIILAPSDPQTHLRFAEKVLPFGKNTYIDKTFAPDCETARKIFGIAEKYGTKFFSSSALRYAAEMEEVTGKRGDVNIFGDSSTDMVEYIIHVIEMMVTIQGVGAKKVRMQTSVDRDDYLIDVIYDDNRKGTIAYCKGIMYRYMVQNGDKIVCKNAETDSFLRLIGHILTFFENSELPFSSEQTIEVMKIRDAVLEARNRIDEEIEIR